MNPAQEALVIDGLVGDTSIRPAPVRGGRRKNPRPINGPLYYATHLILGLLIGSSIGVHSFFGALYGFAGQEQLLGHLWWIVLAACVVAQLFIKTQMDSIRQTIFVKKVGNTIEKRRVRRRPEVVWTLVKRAFVGLLVAAVIVGLLHYGIQHYRHLLGGRGGALPTVGRDVFLALYALVVTAIVLGVCEATLRLTQKEGFKHQALFLFVPASLACSLSILGAAQQCMR